MWNNLEFTVECCHYPTNCCQWGSIFFFFWLLPSGLGLHYHFPVPVISSDWSLPSRSSHIQFTLPRALHCVYIYIQEHSNHNPSPTLCLYYSAYSRPSRETNLSVGKSFKSGGWTVQHGHCYSRVERVPEVSEAVICELRGWTNWECPNWCSAAHRYAKVENTTLLWKNF